MINLTYWQRHCAPYLRAKLAPLAKSERGASLVEYALLLALIAVVCIVAITFLGGEADEKFSQIGSSLNTP